MLQESSFTFERGKKLFSMNTCILCVRACVFDLSIFIHHSVASQLRSDLHRAQYLQQSTTR